MHIEEIYFWRGQIATEMISISFPFYCTIGDSTFPFCIGYCDMADCF